MPQKEDYVLHELWFMDLVFSTFCGLVISGWVNDNLFTN